MITLCTLFNTNYIDKGLTMYESIDRITNDFTLYVLCMDNRCYEILADLNRPRFIPIHLSDFETPELLKIKGERTMGEYCWTCSSCLVDYVMHKYNPDYCAYIDSDLYFYDDVNTVVTEMQSRKASVMIVGHRFNKCDREQMEWKVGKYCVEFNTFKNDKRGNALLTLWKKQCLDYCKCDGDGIHWADQKYLDNWVSDHEGVIETSNLGAGIAPWNVAQYKYVSNNDYGPIDVKCEKNTYRAFFYHFQNVMYTTSNTVYSHTFETWGVSKKLVDCLYVPYLRHIAVNKKMLYDKYGIDVLIKSHPGTDEKKGKKGIKNVLNKIIESLSKGDLKTLYYHIIPTIIYRKKDRIDF